MPSSEPYASWRCKAAPVRPMRPAHPTRKARHRTRRARGRRRREWTPAGVSRCMAVPRPSAPVAIPNPPPRQVASEPVFQPLGLSGSAAPKTLPEVPGSAALRQDSPPGSTCGRYLSPSRKAWPLEIPFSIGSSAKVLSVASIAGLSLTISIPGVVFRNNDLLLMIPVSTDGHHSMSSFCEQLRAPGQQLELSDAAIARRLGISRSRYTNHANGHREPDSAMLAGPRFSRRRGVHAHGGAIRERPRATRLRTCN
jgi:hypothetical protein